MLLISRKYRERIRLETPGGEVIWVTIADIDRGKVKVGITAPAGVKIMREELLKNEPANADRSINPDLVRPLQTHPLAAVAGRGEPAK